MTSLTIAPPDTGADCMRGQRRHCSNCATWWFSNSCRFGLAIRRFKSDARTPRTPKAFRAKRGKLTINFAKLWECALLALPCAGVLASLLTPENRENRQQQAQHDAENDAGNDGKIKCRMLALDANVARQSAQPFWCKTSPHQQAHDRGDHTDDHDEFANLAHRSKSCANWAEAQA